MNEGIKLTKDRLLESGARTEYKPLTLDEIQQILDNQEVIVRLDAEKIKLEQFLSDLVEARKMEHSMLSPVAGILQQGSLDEINRFLGIEQE